MEINYAQLGQIIASERKRRGWTQRDLARVLSEVFQFKTSKSTISRIETGEVEKIRNFKVILEKLCWLFPEVEMFMNEKLTKFVKENDLLTLDWATACKLPAKKSFLRRLLSWRVW